MAGHEKLFCRNCLTTFELAWSTVDNENIEEEYEPTMLESAEYCPFCSSVDIDDPIYFKTDLDESP
tara:strand:- start:49 stop:246 length:198 start_codon:yes stop_codon:yes gene_type:complete